MLARSASADGRDTDAVAIRAITLDLDDTLWPFGPVAVRIEQALRTWMAEHAPGAAIRFDPQAAQEEMARLRAERPELAHDLLAIRRESLRRLLGLSGDDPELADAAIAVIAKARQQVDLYPEVTQALTRLSAQVPLLALTNGNADLARTGVAPWFSGVVSAFDAGIGKPDARIFHLACDRLRLPAAEVLHVGDSLELDVYGALAAGMQAAWIQRDQLGEPPPIALRYRDLTELAEAIEAG